MGLNTRFGMGKRMSPMQQPPPIPVRPKAEASPGRKFLKVFGIAIFSLAGAVGVATLILANWPDEKLGDETQMLPDWEGLGEEGTLGRFQTWLEGSGFAGDDDRLKMLGKDRVWDAEEADVLLREYADVLQEFRAFSGTSEEEWEWRDGEAIATFSHQAPYQKPLMGAAQLGAIHAVREAEAGDPDEGLRLAIQLVKIGDGLKAARGSMPHYLVSTAVSLEGLRAMKHIARNPLLEPAQVREIADNLARANVSKDGLRFSFQTEYLMFKNLVVGLHSGDPAAWDGKVLPRSEKLGAFLQPNATLNFYRDLQEPMITALGSEWPDMNAALETQKKSLTAIKSGGPFGMVHPNPIGEILIAIPIPVFQSIVARSYDEVARKRALGVFLAMGHYERDHGTLPRDVKDLVPDYLTALPIDPFTVSEPLRWDAARRILYSIGRNGIDDGGAIHRPSSARDADVGISWDETVGTPGL